MKLILVSQSPRRKELLEMAGYRFEVFVPDIDEDGFDHDNYEELPVLLARQKVAVAADVFPSDVLIAADTIVVLNGEIIGKPGDESEAFRMLKKLSGNTHTVVTGVCVRKGDTCVGFNDLSLVTFKELSDDEINFYIRNYHPFDKAGSYGCQDFIGLIGIERIEGSFYNVMGLPVHKVYPVLKEFGILPE